MSPVLPIFFTPRADREIETANRWWRENRTAAPDLLKLELRRALDLIASHPHIGAPARKHEAEGDSENSAQQLPLPPLLPRQIQ